MREVYLQSLFSSSVIWMTSGTLKASWSHLVNMKGIKCPRCKASEDGPCSKKHSMACFVSIGAQVYDLCWQHVHVHLYWPQLASHGPESLISKNRYSSSPHPSCVKVEGLPLLICIQQFFKIPMGIEHASSQQWVCWPSC